MKDKIRFAASIIAFVIILELFARYVNSIYFPPISSISIKFFELLVSGIILHHAADSLTRIIAGFLLSCAVGIPLGFIMYEFKWIRQIVEPPIELLRHISPLGLIPAFILFFGIGFMSKVAVIFWVAWIPILINTFSGAASTDSRYKDIAKSMGADRISIFLHIIFPSAFPNIITGLRIGIGSALLALIAAEMIGGSSGLGFYIFQSSQVFDIKEMYAGILAVSIIGFSINFLLIQAEKIFLRWK